MQNVTEELEGIDLEDNPLFLAAPTTIPDTGLDLGFLAELALKALYYGARPTAGELAATLALSMSVTQEVLGFLTRDGLCEIIGGEGQGPSGYRYNLTGKGLERSGAAFERNTYVGPAPVPLKDYVRQVRAQSVTSIGFSPEAVAEALASLVLNPQTLLRVGRAVSSGRPTLLYGASGNGKTTIARRLGEAISGNILVPYVIEMYGHIVRLFDPSKHQPIERPVEQPRQTLVKRRDNRWAIISRPAVLAGGELTRHSLELVFDDRSKVYEAPLQMKASGGILIIDDFGRQQMPAVEMLNRWIVALEGGVDHLSLHTGQTVELPFDCIPLFSTNLAPEALADEAFLRRIRYKVEIPNPTEDEFLAIFRKVCGEYSIAYDDAAVKHILLAWYEGHGRPRRGCHPRDLIEAVLDAASYEGKPGALSVDALEEACRTYFLASSY